jgi:hypothetical protein
MDEGPPPPYVCQDGGCSPGVPRESDGGDSPAGASPTPTNPSLPDSQPTLQSDVQTDSN